MKEQITTICLKNSITSVNCYLIRSDSGYILIDTGFTNCRTIIEQQLESAGCKPGDLTLIVVTHGDFDHIGNCLYIRNKFKSKVAMHNDDKGMAELGDMFWNRKKANFIMKTLAKLLFKLDVADRFSPDITIKDGDDLSSYGFAAKVLTIPGHSKGSIGVLTKNGDLFCGDFFENIKKPKLNSIMDDRIAAQSSIKKLSAFPVKHVYPGHGKSFIMEAFNAKQQLH